MPSITRYIRRYSARFVQHRGGSVAVYTALTMLVMVAAVGIGIDTARAFLLKSKLSQALDAAALAGGKSFVIADSNADINMFFNANFPSGYLGSTVSGPTITQNTANQTITVAATATANTIFGALLGMKTVTVAASSIATRTLTALDVALSIDVSQSMTEKISGSSQSKLAQVQSAATQLVTTLFGGASDAKTITVDGTLYHLLNIGLVTFNSKVNVLNSDAGIPSNIGSDPQSLSFSNPVTGVAQSDFYFAKNLDTGKRISDVPLLKEPDVNWKGCVYARYIDDGDMSNDADLALDTSTMGGKQWMGWEPIPTKEGEAGQGQSGKNPPLCYAAAWNSTKKTTSPVRPSYWIKANPTIDSSTDCTPCPLQGITKLQTTSSAITVPISNLKANGNTNITQGLFWAYEILMHGTIFTQSAENPPFPRQRAIVLLTDGENVGGNGDAYKGVFGSGDNAGTLSNHGQLPATPYWSGGKSNNLNNRLRQLAAEIKTKGAVRVYVIQFANASDTTTTALLKEVASGSEAPFYFNAPTGAALQDAFNRITADLSTLRLSQ